jgi:presequence protease
LHPLIREKGGAYGGGCSVDPSGIVSMYSYRDPNVDKTYTNFERTVQEIIDGNFSDRELAEAKLLAFQKLDKVVEPSLRGLVQFTRGYEQESKMRLRLKALEISRDDLVFVAQKYLMNSIEHNKTSRVVFGSQSADFKTLEDGGWNIFNPIDFLSYSYFDQFNNEE